MKSPENVIVTVQYEGKSIADLEMPTFMPVADLRQRVLESLRLFRPDLFLGVCQLYFCKDHCRLNEDASLASSGVWDGSILQLTIEKEGSYEF